MNLISFDVETWGLKPEWALQPWRAIEGGAGITCFAVGYEVDGRTKTVCTWMYDDVYKGRLALEAFLKFAKYEGAHIVCWNAPFDIAWCLAHAELRDLVFANKWLDGALIYRRVINSPEKGLAIGLKAVVAQYLPKYAGYETGITFDPKSEAEREGLMKYNRLDALFTRELALKFWNGLTPAEQRNARIEAASLPMVAEANLHGLRIDQAHLADLDTHLVNTTEKAYSALLAAEPDIGAVNLNSPDQVAELLFNKWGLTPVKQTETGNDSTDKETLHELSMDYPLAKALRTYREGINNRTKFSTAIATSLAYNGDGVVRPQFRVFGTYTGRGTYSSAQRKGKSRGKNDYPTGFALHQMKRDPLFRKVVAPPSGYTLLEFDFAGQEYRWMAVMSGDETMLSMCGPGEDGHAFMGSRVGGMEYQDLRQRVAAGNEDAKSLRQLGKVGNLSCVAQGEPVLTDRGYVAIEQVQGDDMVWDGVEWVTHKGVVFQGYHDVISYAGITATSDHRVLVRGSWVRFDHAAQMGWHIESPLGAGWTRRAWATIRIMGGIVRRSLRTIWSAVRNVSMRLWDRERSQPTVYGNWAFVGVPRLRFKTPGPRERQTGGRYTRQEAFTKASQRHAAAVSESLRPKLPQLRWSWHRVSLRIREGWRRVHPDRLAERILYRFGYRQNGCQWSLRARQPAPGFTKSQSCKQATYDILNAGPRARFSVGTSIVSNCQYRTSARRLRSVARVEHNIPMDEETAARIHGTYRATYPGVPQYWKKQTAECKHSRTVWTPAGRKVDLVGEWGWSLESTSINFPIQGAGGDQKYLALRIARDYLPKVEGRFYYELHDGLFFIVPHRYAERAASEMKILLSNLPYEKAWDVQLPIKFPVDAKLGPTWGELKEFRA